MENEFIGVDFIWNEDCSECFVVEIAKEFEYKNSISYLLANHVSTRIIPILIEIEVAKKQLKKVELRDALIDFNLSKGRENCKAIREYNEILNKFSKIIIPIKFDEVLSGNFSKDMQSRILDRQELTNLQFEALISKLSTDYGFTLSKYINESLPKGTNEDSLPSIIYNGADNFKYFGKTDLGEGELKNIVVQRKNTMAYFFDKCHEDIWHCLVWTGDGISGKEIWKNKESKPHLHYFSNKWGLTRKDAVAMIKQGNYPSTKVHINFME